MMTIDLRVAALLVPLFVAAVGCDGGELAADAGPGTDDTSVGAAVEGPTNACRRYVECVAALEPDVLGDVDASYGEDGSCWNGSATMQAACDEGCVEGLESKRSRYHDERCDECTDDDDCPADRPRCTTIPHDEWEERRCAGCATDDDCPTGICEDGLGVCVSGYHCGEADGPGGDTLGLRCARHDCPADVTTACAYDVMCCLANEGPAACGSDVACIVELCAHGEECHAALAVAADCVLTTCR